MNETDSNRQDWRGSLRAGLHRATVSLEESVDLAWGRVRGRFGWDRPQWIAAYRGYANGEHCRLTGRVLANRPLGGPGDDDAWWDNLLNSYRRIASREVPGVPVRLRIGGEEIHTTTDSEGYYRVEHRLRQPPGAAGWHEAVVEIPEGDGQPVTALHPYLVPSPEARLGIISDLDDTVLESGATQLLRLAKLTFLHNARTRKPLAGAAELYRALRRGDGQEPERPLFYVSSSPWNLYDLIEDFLELNGLPQGPILLRDYGIDAGKLIAESGHGHKLDKVRSLLGAFPELPFVLIGDSGQEDAQIYAQAIAEHPGRILAVYVRDIDPDHESEHDRRVDASFAEAARHGVPMLRVIDSEVIAHHAVRIGLLPPEEQSAVEAGTEIDRQRPDLTEALLEG